MLVLLVGRLVIAVAGGVAGERRISTSCRVRGGGAAGLPLENCTSLFGIASTDITVCLFVLLISNRSHLMWPDVSVRKSEQPPAEGGVTVCLCY